jgi:hypothetical protein
MMDSSVWTGLGSPLLIELVVINWAPLVCHAGYGDPVVTKMAHPHGAPSANEEGAM